MSEAGSDKAPPIFEPEMRTLTVTVKSLEGLNFATELGNQQIAVSILFPGHNNDTMSPLLPPAPKISFDFTENYQIQFYPDTTINALLQTPLEFFVYVCTPDMKKQNQVVKFSFQFDQLLFVQQYTAIIDGILLQEGNGILPQEGIKANVSFSWDTAIVQPEELEESIVASFSLSAVTSLPQAILNSCTTPNNFSTHVFTYTLVGYLPDGQLLCIEDGKFSATSQDGTDAVITFPNSQKFFINPERFEKWKEAAENEENVSIYMIPELSPLLAPLGINPHQYAALYSRIDIPFSQFAKPGRSHFLGQVPVVSDPKYTDEERPFQSQLPNGFPPEPVDPTGRKKAPARKQMQSSRQSAKSKAAGGGKKPKSLSAKDKKTLQILQNVFQFGGNDVFQESAAQMRVEIALSKPLIPRCVTPISTKPPQEVVPPLPKLHGARLANATNEYLRQINIAIDQLSKEHEYSDELIKLIKEQIKPSVVEVVKQVFLHKNPPHVELSDTLRSVEGTSGRDDRQSQLSNNSSSSTKDVLSSAFIAELRSYLMVHLNKAINQRYKLTFPANNIIPTDIDVETLTRRIHSQSVFKSDDLDILHSKRCDLDPLNPQWPYEYALYLSDQKDHRCLDYFARAISIDYGFKAAILGFCAQLTQTGDRADALVLLDMIYSEQPEDPVITVCLSVVYTLLESSKCDEFMAKISNMSQRLNKSPYVAAAAALIDVHDTFISETCLSKEQQLQGQRTKELLLLLARFAQMTQDYQRAQEYLKEALEMNQEDISLWKLLGDFQFEAGDKDKAKQSFTSVLTLAEDPDATSCLKLALIKLNEGEYAATYDLLMYTVQKEESVLGWLALGVCCLRMGDYEEADASLSRANELDRWYPLTWGYCALLCIKMGRLVEASQSITFAHSLGLKDYRLIHEIIEEASNVELSETASQYLKELGEISKDDCYPPFESQTTV